MVWAATLDERLIVMFHPAAHVALIPTVEGQTQRRGNLGVRGFFISTSDAGSGGQSAKIVTRFLSCRWRRIHVNHGDITLLKLRYSFGLLMGATVTYTLLVSRSDGCGRG